MAGTGKEDKALIVVDMQQDFCEGGALAIPGSLEIIEPINVLMLQYNHVILTQDWHPAQHISFASRWSRTPYSTLTLPGSYEEPYVIMHPEETFTITLWPDHCIAGTPGAEFHQNLDTVCAELIVRKGMDLDREEYSPFDTPGLAEYLRAIRVHAVDIVGLTFDYSVKKTAIDAYQKHNFDVSVLKHATRSVSVGDHATERHLQASGIRVL